MRWNVAESLLLLAVDDLEGTVRGGFPLDVGLAAAELVTAAGLERIKVEGWRIEAVDDAPTGDADLDAVLAAVARHARTHPAPVLLGVWLERRRAVVRALYLSRLQREGVLCHARRRLLGLVRVHRYPLCDLEAAVEPWRRLDLAAGAGWGGDHEAAALAALAHITGLGHFLYPGRSGAPSRDTLRALALPGRAPEPLAAILGGTAHQIEATVTAAAQTCR